MFLIGINEIASDVYCSLKIFADDNCLNVAVDDSTSARLLNNLIDIKQAVMSSWDLIIRM